VVARLEEREEDRRLRRETAREGAGAGTSLEARDAALATSSNTSRQRLPINPPNGLP
jgi:hypothetical protein